MKSGNVILATALSCLMATAAFAADATSWTGFLVDRMCSSTQKTKTSAESLKFAEGHTKDCALTPACKKAGYALLSDGKWLNLDNQGDKMAIATFQSSKKDTGLKVRVDGQMKGDVIQVSKITEVK